MYRSIPGFDPERKASEDPDDSYDWNIYTDATTALPDVSARLSEAITNGEPRWYIEGLGKIRAHQTTISHSSFALSSQSQQQLSEAVEPSQPAQIPTLGNLCLGLLARARLLLVQGTLPISLNCSCPEKEDTRTPPVLQVAKDQCIRATKLSIPILETSNIEPVTPGKVIHERFQNGNAYPPRFKQRRSQTYVAIADLAPDIPPLYPRSFGNSSTALSTASSVLFHRHTLPPVVSRLPLPHPKHSSPGALLPYLPHLGSPPIDYAFACKAALMWSGARVDDITPSPSQPRTALILPVEFHRRAVPYRLPQIPLVMRGVFYQGTRSHREFIRRFGYDLGRHTQSIYDSLLQARTVEAIDEHIFQFLALLDSGSFDLRRCVSQHSLATAISTIEKLERQGVFKDQLRRALASLSYASSSSESSGLVGLTHQHLLHIVPSTVLATVATFMDDEEFGIFADRYPHLLLHTEFRNRLLRAAHAYYPEAMSTLFVTRPPLHYPLNILKLNHVDASDRLLYILRQRMRAWLLEEREAWKRNGIASSIIVDVKTEEEWKGYDQSLDAIHQPYISLNSSSTQSSSSSSRRESSADSTSKDAESASEDSSSVATSPLFVAEDLVMYRHEFADHARSLRLRVFGSGNFITYETLVDPSVPLPPFASLVDTLPPYLLYYALRTRHHLGRVRLLGLRRAFLQTLVTELEEEAKYDNVDPYVLNVAKEAVLAKRDKERYDQAEKARLARLEALAEEARARKAKEEARKKEVLEEKAKLEEANRLQQQEDERKVKVKRPIVPGNGVARPPVTNRPGTGRPIGGAVVVTARPTAGGITPGIRPRVAGIGVKPRVPGAPLPRGLPKR